MSHHFSIKDMLYKGLMEVSPGVWAKPSKGVGKVSPTSKVKGVKKHKYNAKAVDSKGVHYDSQREYQFSLLLDQHGIKYRMKDRIVLQPSFEYMGEKIREIAIMPDYIILRENSTIAAIVDIKGLIMPDFRIKIKMLKHTIAGTWGFTIPIFMPTNKKEMAEVITELLKLVKH